MNTLESDLERWLRDKLTVLASDALMRADIAGVDGNRLFTALIVELAARCVAGTTMPPSDAGEMFATAVSGFRKSQKLRGRDR